MRRVDRLLLKIQQEQAERLDALQLAVALMASAPKAANGKCMRTCGTVNSGARPSV